MREPTLLPMLAVFIWGLFYRDGVAITKHGRLRDHPSPRPIAVW